MDDLWPSEIFNTPKITPPVKILHEQASILNDKTYQFLEGEITDNSTREDFNFSFYIKAPTINNYRYRLLSINYDIEFFPLQLITDISIVNELGISHTGGFITVNSEEELNDVLKSIFNSSKVRKVISALLSMTDYKDYRKTDQLLG